MKTLLLLCFALLFAGCNTRDPKDKIVGPPAIEQSSADADGITVNAKSIPMPGPLLPGQARPHYMGDPDATGVKTSGDPDADEIQKGDPTTDD